MPRSLFQPWVSTNRSVSPWPGSSSNRLPGAASRPSLSNPSSQYGSPLIISGMVVLLQALSDGCRRAPRRPAVLVPCGGSELPPRPPKCACAISPGVPWGVPVRAPPTAPQQRPVPWSGGARRVQWTRLDGLDGAHEVDQAVALEVPLAPERGRVLAEQPLDLLGPADELAPDRQEPRDRAGHVWRGHARAGVVDVAGRVVAERRPGGDRGKLPQHPAGRTRGDPLPRRHQVGLETPVAGRALGGEVRHPVGVGAVT